VRESLLPPTPPLVLTEPVPEEAAPTKQARPTGLDGSPLEALSTCRWCGGMHPTACPYIKVAEWFPNGQVARIVLKERPELEKAILYPFEEDEDHSLRRALNGVIEAPDLEHAQGIARALLQVLDVQEKQT